MTTAQRLLESLHEVNLGVSDKSILIYDGGCFTSVAERIARDAGKVSYFVPWYSSELKIARSYIGHGLDKVEVTTDFWGLIDSADLIFFPDVYQWDLMELLSTQGYSVLGSGKSSILELNKKESRDICVDAGINMSKSEVVVGLDSLIEFLKGKTNKVVKPVIFRGESETFKYVDEESSKSLFDKVSLNLGPFANDYEFLVEDMVEGIECGVDGIVTDGEYLNPLLFGATSGYGYLAKVLPEENIPDPFKNTLSKLLPIFKQYETRMFFGTEEIYDKKSSYLLDLTLRMSNCHVSSIWTELISNFSEVVYGLGTGEKVDLSTDYTHCGSAVLVVSHEVDEWATIKSPEGSENWLKLEYNAKNKEGDYVIAPRGQVTIGAIISLGNSWDEVIAQLQERFEQVSCSIPLDPIPGESEFREIIEKVKEYGIEFD